MKNLQDCLFTKDHEWLKVEGDYAYIGITDYAQEQLGEIVYVELPQVEDVYSTGSTFGVVESVKAASDIYIPVSGKIVEVNEALDLTPELINEDAYANWMVKIEILDATELDQLMKADEYNQYCQEE